MICGICQSSANLRYASHPGYRVDSAYDIYECAGCGASFASPLHADARIYEQIYERAASISGYDRYVRYADLVQDVKNPRAVLAASEDVYYAIDVIVRRIEPTAPRLLEIGSGLGYLTYALARSGSSIEGWDIAEVAVRSAIERFGAHYRMRDVFAPVASDANRFDAIIMTELIEHVEDPVAFLEAARRFLAPGGSFILTTPNKAFYAPSLIWHTDPPPVHLWWLAERSIQRLGERLDMNVRFFDFSRYNDWHHLQADRTLSSTTPSRDSMLTSAGEPIRVAAAAEQRQLFPLSQSVVPLLRGAARMVARTLGVPVNSTHRRPTCAFELGDRRA